MQIEIGKTYLTKNGKEILITDILFGKDDKPETWRFLGKSECGWSERYNIDGSHWNYWFRGGTFNNPDFDIISLSLFSK